MQDSDILKYSTLKYEETTVVNLPTPQEGTVVSLPITHPKIGTIFLKFRYEGLNNQGLRVWKEVLT